MIEVELREGLSGGPARPPDIAAAAEAAGLLEVAYAHHDSPLGRLCLAATRRGLITVAYGDPLEVLAERVSPRILHAPARLEEARRELEAFFTGRLRAFATPLDLTLTTGFQREVLRATRAIPFGAVASYAEVAAAAGRPRAFRAAGTALGRNPLPIVIPCHRVLRAGGALGQYTGGAWRKQALLELEGVELRP
jgi:methylated-DNA-[protein]-cysteine S-methyltransferase